MNGGASLALPRIVQREILDDLAADDPRAQRSRRDLVRVHRAMGTRAILDKALRSLQLDRIGPPLRILELGAGDGSLLLRLARALAPIWPRVELTLLDRQPLVSAATLAGFAALGWTATSVVADALDWARLDVELPTKAGVDSGAGMGATWHLIVANLFLHHFSGDELSRLLAGIAARGERLVACEPRRARLALVGSHLLGAIGAGAVTREDAVLSVHAGFRGEELSEQWSAQWRSARAQWRGQTWQAPSWQRHAPGAVDDPAPDASWRLAEYPAGLFSHCFVAERRAV